MSQSFQAALQLLQDNASEELREHLAQNVQIVLAANTRSFDDLLALVQDQKMEIDVRMRACWLLGQLHNKRAVHALLTVFWDQHPHLRRQAAHTLGIIKSKRAVKPLIAALQGAASADQRANAAYALGLLGDERAAEPLVTTLNNISEDANVRGHAAESLTYLPKNSTFAIPALANALADPAIAQSAVWDEVALHLLENLGGGLPPELRRNHRGTLRL